MDILLVDQLLKGRVEPDARVVDVGAGSGRNLTWFLTGGHGVRVIEPDPERLDALEERLARWGTSIPADHRHVARVEDADAPAGSGDLVICNAVLHFAADEAHFERMLRATWRLVAPGGLFFARLASSIGIEDRVVSLGQGRFLLPDESERFLVDEAGLLRWTAALGAEQLEPIRTSVVQGLRAMTTWVLRRPAPLS